MQKEINWSELRGQKKSAKRKMNLSDVCVQEALVPVLLNRVLFSSQEKANVDTTQRNDLSD